MKEADNEDLWSLTQRSLERGDFTFLDDLLNERGASIIDLLDANDASGDYSAEALTWAAFSGRLDEVRTLLDRGVDPAAGIATGMSALHWAANRGQPETVRLLIERGAPLEQKNMYDGTVLGGTLHAAIYEHRPTHAAIVESILAAGAEFDQTWIDWWNDQNVPSAEAKQSIASSLEKYLKPSD